MSVLYVNSLSWHHLYVTSYTNGSSQLSLTLTRSVAETQHPDTSKHSNVEGVNKAGRGDDLDALIAAEVVQMVEVLLCRWYSDVNEDHRVHLPQCKLERVQNAFPSITAEHLDQRLAGENEETVIFLGGTRDGPYINMSFSGRISSILNLSACNMDNTIISASSSICLPQTSITRVCVHWALFNFHSLYVRVAKEVRI